LSFHARFASLVESGQKTQSIRAPRKRPIVVNDRVYLYTGMRTKACRKLGEGLVESVSSIQIKSRGAGDPFPLVWIRSLKLGDWQLDDFARADGFADAREMRAWFEESSGLPFTGSLIRWRLLQRAAWRREAT
jgi:hypothetical protein